MNMQIKELIKILEQLRKLYAAGGAKPAERDLAKFIQCLSPHHGQQLEAFIAHLGATSLPKATKQKAVKAADEDIVAAHLGRLTQAGTNRIVFDQAYAALSQDKGVKVSEA